MLKKRPVAWNRALLATSTLCLAAAPSLRAQTTAPAPAAADTNEEAIVLSPFVVDASADQNGYRANSTLAGTRVRTDLKDVSSAISVVTQQFLQDTGAKNNNDLLVYTPSTEVAGLRGNFSGVAGSHIYQENLVSTSTRVRGLDSADNTRDYFLTDIPWDGFNVGRVDLQRGPNSILFGIGSPAGIINTSVNDAAFKRKYSFENVVDQYGTIRDSIDVNQPLVSNVLALRIAAVHDNQKFEQKPAFNNSQRYFGALRFDPKLFSEDNRTSFRAKYEYGKVNSNNPRQIPPNDSITPWFKTGVDQYGNPGYNKVILNQFNPAQVFNGVAYPGGKNGVLWNGLWLANQTRSFWPDVINYYEATPQSLNNVAAPKPPGGAPMLTYVAQPQTDLAGPNNGGLNTAVNQAFLPAGIPMFSNYAQFVGTTVGFPGYAGVDAAGNAKGSIPGGVYYANQTLRDPSIFNFYKKLLDGPNKREWQNWKAVNLVLDQGFFNDRLAFEAAWDHQEYTSGQLGWLQGEQYSINVDINATFADGSPNPNAGRPYVGNAASAPGQNWQSSTTRDSLRFTGTGELRASDFLGETKLAKILGRHVFTGLLDRSTVVKNFYNFAPYATTPQYSLDNQRGNNVNGLGSGRSFEWIAYLGPNLSARSSAAGANLSTVQFAIQPPASQTARNFKAVWNKPTNSSAPGYVDPTAPFTYVNYVTGATVTGTQADNPANYVGWSNQPVTWMRWDNPAEFASLVTSATRTRFRDTSQGATWQGYFLGGDLVPTVGWRKDVITSYQTASPSDALTGYTSLAYDDDLASRADIRGESKTWGAVYHLPSFITSHLPWDSTISLFYNRGSNFKADASRLDLAGNRIPNATGNTKEYGITITTLQDKLSLKVAKFKTKVKNASLADTQANSIGGLGNNAYFLADGAIWGYGWATYLQDAILLKLPGTDPNNYGDYATSDGFNRNTPADAAAADNYNINGGTSPSGRTYAGAKAVIDAWLHLPLPAGYFQSFNLTPLIDHTRGQKTGRLRDSYINGFDDNNGAGANLGGGSNFGNHHTTVDNLSSGTEVELTFQPVKNWNIGANYVRVNATHENVDPVSVGFIGTMTKFMNGPGGQIREWYNGDPGMLKGQWNSSIVAPYAVLMNELGHEAPEVAPWRLNVVSTYTFDHGFAKGVFVGGAWREEAGRIIGYAYDPNFKNSITSDPNFSDVSSLTLGGLNVNKPFRGSNESHFDVWVGYSRKITRDINWRIQLNIRDVGTSDRLITSRVNPDGSIALQRIQQGAGYRLTNSFDF